MNSEDIARRLDRHEAFLACAPVKRPLLGLWPGGYYPGDQYPNGVAGWADGQLLDPSDVTFARFAADYDRLYQWHLGADDDFFLVASAYWGIPWMEAILGCGVRVAGSTCRAEPPGPGDGPERGARWLQAMVAFTRDLVAHADDRFPVAAPLLRGPGDCLAALRGSMAFVTDCVDDPAGIAAGANAYLPAWRDALGAVEAVIPPWCGAYAAGGFPSRVCARQRAAYTQDDAAALLNPRLFERLLGGAHAAMSAWAPVTFVHLHSACLYPVEALLERTSYRVIEVNLDHEGAGPPLARIVPVLRRIQEAGRPLALWGRFSRADWELAHTALDPAGLSLQPIVETEVDRRIAMMFR